MKQFIDQNGCQVQIAFGKPFFSTKVGHVWIVCRYEDKWLLTKHKRRGLEFPGGKVEQDETPENAAKREVFEETGGVVDSLTFIGQYEVRCTEKLLQKNVYFAHIDELEKRDHYYETEGPVLLDHFPTRIQTDSQFSFIMKDDVLPLVVKEVYERGLVYDEEDRKDSLKKR